MRAKKYSLFLSRSASVRQAYSDPRRASGRGVAGALVRLAPMEKSAGRLDFSTFGFGFGDVVQKFRTCLMFRHTGVFPVQHQRVHTKMHRAATHATSQNPHTHEMQRNCKITGLESFFCLGSMRNLPLGSSASDVRRGLHFVKKIKAHLSV